MTESMPNLTEMLRRALEQLDACIKDAGDRIDMAPDNPAVTRLGDGRAFRIASSNVAASGRWDVFFHDWKAQYRHARELLDQRRFAALRDLLSGHGYRDPSYGHRAYAPQVIENIKAITGDLLVAEGLTNAAGLMKQAAGSRLAPRP